MRKISKVGIKDRIEDEIVMIKKVDNEEIKFENESIQIIDDRYELKKKKTNKLATSTQLSSNLENYISANKFANTTSDVLLIGRN